MSVREGGERGKGKGGVRKGWEWTQGRKEGKEDIGPGLQPPQNINLRQPPV